jgi:hypothetical protein
MTGRHRRRFSATAELGVRCSNFDNQMGCSSCPACMREMPCRMCEGVPPGTVSPSRADLPIVPGPGGPPAPGTHSLALCLMPRSSSRAIACMKVTATPRRRCDGRSPYRSTCAALPACSKMKGTIRTPSRKLIRSGTSRRPARGDGRPVIAVSALAFSAISPSR